MDIEDMDNPHTKIVWGVWNGPPPREPDVSQIADRLWLGDETSPRAINQLGITHVVRALSPDYPRPLLPVMAFEIAMFDDPSSAEAMRRTLPAALAFIDRAIADGGRVLVHCQAGISRSATIVVAWVMRRHGIPVHAALAHVRALRPVVCPNPGFMEVLSKL
jgi:protein tyrosine phosphatase